MIQTILVYGFMAFAMCSLSIINSDKRATFSKRCILLNPLLIIYITIYVFFCAVRFDVGIDYPAYFNNYIHASIYTNSNCIPNYELFFEWFTWFLSKNGISFQVYFGLIALVQITFLLLSFKKYPKLLPFATLIFFICGYFISFQNILRQNLIVIGFLFIALNYRKISIFYYTIIVFLFYFIHKSCIVLIPLYFLLNDNSDLRVKPWFNVVILLCCALFGANSANIEAVFDNPLFISILELSDYSVYNSDLMTLGMGNSIGFGFILRLLTDMLVVYFAPKLSTETNINGFNAYFRIFFIGLAISYCFPTSMLINRPILYFLIFGLLIYSSFLYIVLIKNTKLNFARIAGMLFIIANIFLFLNGALFKSELNAYRYIFYWQVPNCT